MLHVYVLNKAYPIFLFLFFMPNLHGAGYVFLKKRGIPEQLIPQDCPARQMPEVSELTPTQAHMYARYKSGELNISKFRNKIGPYNSIIQTILKNEYDYSKTHYMFYHAQMGSFRFLQDFLKEFYALLNIQRPYSNFEFLRAFHIGIAQADIDQFLKDEAEAIKNDYTFDCSKRIVSKLLSVNLSLFGNSTYHGECTFDYFMNELSCSSFDISWIAQTIEKVIGIKLTESECTMLDNLFEEIAPGGTLFQICVPKDKVDSCVYLSHAYGIPYRESLVSDCYDSKKKRHTRISDILEQYSKPGFCDNFYTLDHLQARILLSQDIVLNPNSNVKLFRFTSTDILDSYHEGLRQFVHTIAARYLAQTVTFLKQGNMPFNRLADMMFNRS